MLYKEITMAKETLVIGTTNTIIGSLGLVDKKPEPKKEDVKPAEVKKPEVKAEVKPEAKVEAKAPEKKPADAKSAVPEKKVEAKPAEKTAGSRIPPVSHIDGIPQR